MVLILIFGTSIQHRFLEGFTLKYRVTKSTEQINIL